MTTARIKAFSFSKKQNKLTAKYAREDEEEEEAAAAA